MKTTYTALDTSTVATTDAMASVFNRILIVARMVSARRLLVLMEGLSAPDSRLLLFLSCSFDMVISRRFGDLTRPSEVAFDAGVGVLAPSACTRSHRGLGCRGGKLRRFE